MADRFWVGGSGNWSNTARWSTSSGGLGGATSPEAGDNAIFDTLSSISSYEVTLDSFAEMHDITVSAPLSGNVTFNCTSSVFLTINGDITFYPGMVWTGAGTTDTPRLRIVDNTTVQNTCSLDMRDCAYPYSIQIGFSQHLNTTTLISTATIGGNIYFSGGASFNSGTLIVNASLTADGIIFENTNAGASLQSNSTSLTVNRLIATSSGSKSINIFNGITLTGTGTVWDTNHPSTSCSVNQITSTGGTATISAHTSHGGNFAGIVATGSGTLTLSGITSVRDLIFTGFTGTCSPGALEIRRHLTLSSAMTFGGTGTLTFVGETPGSTTFTTAGKNITRNVVFNRSSYNFIISGNLNLGTTNSVTLTAGTLVLQGDITTGTFISSGSSARSISFGTRKIVLTSTAATTVWNLATSTGMSFSGTPHIEIVGASTNAKTFAGGSLSYDTLHLNSPTANALYIISGNNTFANLILDNPPQTLHITGGATQTITDTFDVNGAPSQLVTLGSTTTTSGALNYTGGGQIHCEYLSISRNTAAPTDTWFATNSVRGVNVSGWNFLYFAEIDAFAKSIIGATEVTIGQGLDAEVGVITGEVEVVLSVSKEVSGYVSPAVGEVGREFIRTVETVGFSRTVLGDVQSIEALNVAVEGFMSSAMGSMVRAIEVHEDAFTASVLGDTGLITESDSDGFTGSIVGSIETTRILLTEVDAYSGLTDGTIEISGLTRNGDAFAGAFIGEIETAVGITVDVIGTVSPITGIIPQERVVTAYSSRSIATIPLDMEDRGFTGPIVGEVTAARTTTVEGFVSGVIGSSQILFDEARISNGYTGRITGKVFITSPVKTIKRIDESNFTYFSLGLA